MAALALVTVTGCSLTRASGSPPVPAGPPAETAPAPLPLLAPAAAAGSYRLRAQFERDGGGAQRRRRAPAETPLVLTTTVSPAPQAGAPSTTFNASVMVPGYTRPPRGRSTAPAAWWPVPGDSVVIQVGAQRGDLLQLRGRLEGRSLRGELWYLSMESGNSLQLGTFTAQRR